MATVHELQNTIDVETPLGYGKAIAWLDYGTQTNTVWKVVLYENGKVRNFYDDDIKVYPNRMDGGNDLTTPQERELQDMKAKVEATSPYNDGWTQEFYKRELNSGHRLELMDRLHVGMTQLNDFVAEHPLLSKIEGARSSVNTALEKLAEAYQQVGNYDQELKTAVKQMEQDWMDHKYKREYEAALTTGMFFEWYPNLTGKWEEDKYWFSHEMEHSKRKY